MSDPKRGKVVISVEFEFPLTDVQSVRFRSKKSLADADIIIFQPNLEDYNQSSSNYYFQGKRNISSDDSFRLSEDLSHWRSELSNAVRDGKTVFVFLEPYEEVYIDTGTRTTSCTGRNQKTTHVVTPTNNYRSVPVEMGVITVANGQEMRLAPNETILAAYWKEFGPYSKYHMLFTPKAARPLLFTKTGDRVTSAIWRGGSGAGSIVLLPPLLRDAPQRFVRERMAKSGVSKPKNPTANGEKPEALNLGPFWRRFFASLVEMERAIHAGRERTPAPEWTSTNTYRTAIERKIQYEIIALTKQIEQAQQSRDKLHVDLEVESRLRALLFEKGKPLEEAIVAALKLLGFKAEPYKQGESEFDVVFSSSEGRFLGEAEGKDNAAVNVDKFRQLEANIQEDFQRDGVTAHAKGVLFGNAHRLEVPERRPEFFTAKCVSSAMRLGVALVRTPDLFTVARYLRDQADGNFAEQCRKAIFDAAGTVVTFPALPVPCLATDNVEQAAG
jgi:hypothetical protein